MSLQLCCSFSGLFWIVSVSCISIWIIGSVCQCLQKASWFFFFKCYFFFFLLLIYFYFLAVLGLRFCARAFSSCGKRGPLFIVVRGPLTIAASLVAEHRLQTRRLSSCGSRSQLLRGMWDLPSPGLEPVSPALAGRFSTTAPPGNPPADILIGIVLNQYINLRSITVLLWGIMIHAHGMFFHLFRSLISFTSIL